ncbi:hypothetical protein ACFYVL_09730 [Streptomyces sp. NPDC004111]|uniref:hypothetical protein n=1 Tax=Streptomyces sp. NPDC004111 TaxID=3364690 RepID=UPI003699C289
MRERALFRTSFRTAGHLACVLALTVGASACAADPPPLTQSPEPLGESTLRDAVLDTKETAKFRVSTPMMTENSGQLLWRTEEKACAPLLDTIGRGDFDAVRSVHASFWLDPGDVRPTALTLGSYRPGGAKKAMEQLEKALTCKPFPAVGPMNRRYEVTVQHLDGLRAGEESRRFALDMVPADSRDPHLVHEVNAARAGNLTTLTVIEVTLSGGLPDQRPTLGPDGVTEFLQRQYQKLNRPPEV